MGNFYTSITLRGADRELLIAALDGRTAAVSPTVNGFTVIWDQVSESQDQAILIDLASKLSRTSGGPAWAVLVHDDDVLWYVLLVNGTPVDEYDSTPGYFDPTAPVLPPKGGNSRVLCNSMERPDVTDRVEEILRAQRTYAFETNRHQALAQALGMPEFVAGYNYYRVSTEDLADRRWTEQGIVFTGQT